MRPSFTKGENLTLAQEARLNQDRARWSAGNFHLIGARATLNQELFCEAADPRPGQRVLDVAGGTGNVAFAAARRFADVTLQDLTPELIELAKQRAVIEGLELQFDCGNAEEMPYPNDSFDVVLSFMGVMFTPNHQKMADELLRVCKPGGKIGLGNWTPEGMLGQMFGVLGRYLPAPPPDAKPPVLWGTPAYLQELFGDRVRIQKLQYRNFMNIYLSATHMVEYFRTHYGPMIMAFDAVAVEEQEHLAADLTRFYESWNTADDGTLAAPAAYLEAILVKR